MVVEKVVAAAPAAFAAAVGVGGALPSSLSRVVAAAAKSATLGLGANASTGRVPGSVPSGARTFE